MKADILLKELKIIFDFDNQREFDDFIEFMEDAGYKVKNVEGIE